MKVKLFFGLAALILLSAISGIFTNMSIIGVSAQDYENIDDGNYGPPNYGYEEEQYYGYDNSYGNAYNNEYIDDSYYGDQYDKNYYPPKDLKKFTCPDSGIVVDKEENCPLICPAGTDLEGHLVAAGSNLQVVCDEDAQFETCPAGTDLEGVLVANAPEDCNIFLTCPANTPLAGAEVTDLRLCNIDTDVTIVNNTEAQCLKCVDLALLAAPPGQVRTLVEALIGNDTNPVTTGIFDICGADDPRPAFNTTVSAVIPGMQAEDVIEVFNTCVENAPGSTLSTSAFSLPMSSSVATLQENSLTTNVRPESGISTFSSPPTIAQGTGDSSSALEKTEKLKQQWLDLLP